MTRESTLHSITRGNEVYLFSTQKSGNGKARSFVSEFEAMEFVQFLFGFITVENSALLFELSHLCASEHEFNGLALSVHRQRIKSVATALFQQRLFCQEKRHTASIGKATPAEEAASAPLPPTKASSDGKAQAATGSDKVGNEPIAESAKKHQTGGDPVSMVTGEELLSLKDLEDEQGFVWQRHYRSSLCLQDFGMGYGWRSNYHFSLYDRYDEESNLVGWCFVDDMGDEIAFEPVELGAISHQGYVGANCLYHLNGYRVVTLRCGNQYKFLPSEHGWCLSQIRETNFHQYDLRYSTNGRLIEIERNGVLAIRCQYDNDGRLIGLRCPVSDALLVSYQQNEFWQLASVTNQHGLCERYQYSPQHLLLQRQIASGFCHYFEWQGEAPHAKCTRNYGDHGIYDYRFKFVDERSYYTDSLGNQWTFEHDSQGKLLKKISPEGRQWQWQYDELGRVSVASFPQGTFLESFYNEFGQLAATKHSSGAIERFSYNHLGQRISTINADGEHQSYHFNSLGQLAQRSDAEQGVTQYQYDKQGRLIAAHNSNGTSERWWWDASNRLLASQSNQTLIRHSYNKQNQLNGLAYPNGMIAAIEHNQQGQLSRISHYHPKEPSIGREHSYCYDDAGRLLQLATPSGTTSFEWAGLSQPELLIKSDGSQLSFNYDAERNLTAIERSDGRTFKLAFTPDGLLASTESFDRVTQHYSYDQGGRLSELTCVERRLKVGYNAHQEVSVLRAREGVHYQENRYHHSLAGKLLTAANEARTVRFQYQDNGRLECEWQAETKLSYQYNHQNRWQSVLLPTGERIEYRYNDFGQLESVAFHHGEKGENASLPDLVLRYDDMGRVCQLEYGEGQTEQRCFDGIGRLKSQQWEARTRNYRFDPSHNLASIVDSALGHHYYQYDELNQLSSAKTPSGSLSCSFDSFGNPQGEGVESEGDRVVQFGQCHYQYDAQGNQLFAFSSENRQRRGFNALNQLVEVNHNGELSQYQYDALGRRCKKITEHGITEFIWQGSKLLGEVTSGQYRWYLYHPDSFAPLMLVENGQCYFYQNDHIGTPIRLVDSSGSIVWQAKYTAMGFANIEIATITNPLRFQGQYFDQESGLHYNLARHYDPHLGRFIQPDPIGLLGGINPYQCAPNPINWVDPTGLCCESPSVVAGTQDNEPEKALISALLGGVLGPISKVNNPTDRLAGGSAKQNDEPVQAPAAKKASVRVAPPVKKQPRRPVELPPEYKITVELAGQWPSTAAGLTLCESSGDKIMTRKPKPDTKLTHRSLVEFEELEPTPKTLHLTIPMDGKSEPLLLRLADNIQPVDFEVDKPEWETVLVPVRPLAYLDENQDKANAAELKGGYLYLFWKNKLWRELEVMPSGEYRDIDVESYRQQAAKKKPDSEQTPDDNPKAAKPEPRKALGARLTQLWVPYKVAGNIAQGENSIKLDFSPTQKTWQQIEALEADVSQLDQISITLDELATYSKNQAFDEQQHTSNVDSAIVSDISDDDMPWLSSESAPVRSFDASNTVVAYVDGHNGGLMVCLEPRLASFALGDEPQIYAVLKERESEWQSEVELQSSSDKGFLQAVFFDVPKSGEFTLFLCNPLDSDSAEKVFAGLSHAEMMDYQLQFEPVQLVELVEAEPKQQQQSETYQDYMDKWHQELDTL